MLSASLADLRRECPALADHIETKCRPWLDGHLTSIRKIQKRTLKPRPRKRVDQLTDEKRYIPSTASGNHGKFYVGTYEIARGPMMAVTEPGVRIITVAAATQLMKTTLLESTALYFMLVDPAPMILVEANESLAKEVGVTKIGGMIDNTPEALAVQFKRTQMRVPFVGGILKIVTAQSENELKSFAARVSMCDEIDGYPLLLGGNAVSLTEERTSSFGERALNIRVCSPTVEEGNIWVSFMAGDRRLPFVDCPCCGESQVMRWTPSDIQREIWKERNTETECPDRTVLWDKKASTNDSLFDTAKYHCIGCGEGWSEGQRLKAIDNVKWRQTKPFSCCETYQEPEREKNWDDWYCDSDGQHRVGYATCKVCGDRAVPNRHASFNANRLYSPKPLSEMVAKWEEASKHFSTLKTFVNGSFAEPWIDKLGIKHTAEGLAARAEYYSHPVPERCVILVIGVDVQDDRLEYEIVGFGREDETWSIEYGVLIGDPQEKAVWGKLDEVFRKKFDGGKRFDGTDRKLSVSAGCIDYQGHNSQAVYAYCLQRQGMNIWPIIGENMEGKDVSTPWPKTATYVGPAKISSYRIGTTAIKTRLNKCLARTMPGPMFCHFPQDRHAEWYQGLLAEKQVMKSGVYRWVPKGDARNEPLDCRVYAMAAMEGLRAQQSDPYLVEHLADAMGIGRTLTMEELTRFANAEEAARIAEETEKSLEQRLAKPIKNKKAAQNFVSKQRRRTAEQSDPERQLAKKTDDASQYVSSDHRTDKSYGSPLRRKPAPFRIG